MIKVKRMLSQKRLDWTDIHLDALRGLAALVVVLGHARGLFFSTLISATSFDPVATQKASEASERLSIGHEAVIVFFVLSGYLVGGSVLRAFSTGSWSWRDYLVKRIVRLWIVLIPAILIGIVLDQIGMQFFTQAGGIYTAPAGQDYVTSNVLAEGYAPSTILGNIFFLQTVFVPMAGVNQPLWSLANEFWYYLLFPLLLLVVQPKAAMVRRVACVLGAIGLMALIGGHASYLFLTWTLGALVAWAPRAIPRNWAPKTVPVAALLFAVACFGARKFGLTMIAGETLMAILSGALIYVIKCQVGTTQPSLYSRAAHFFSRISYTLYLTHLPFVVLLCAIVNAPWSKWTFLPLTVSLFVAVCTAAVLWATLLYNVFEAKTDAARAAVIGLLARWSRLRQSYAPNV